MDSIARLSRLVRVALRVAIPVVVGADTIWSFYRVHQLARARLQEWQQEEDEALHADVAATLKQLAGKCAKADKDFWPAALNVRLGLGALDAAPKPAAAGAQELAGVPAAASFVDVALPAAAAAGAAAAELEQGGVWQMLGLAAPASEHVVAPVTTAADSPTGAAAQVCLPSRLTDDSVQSSWQAHPSPVAEERQVAWAADSEQQQFEAGRQVHASSEQLLQQPEAAAQGRETGHGSSLVLHVVTLRDAVGHVMQSTATAATSLTSPPAGVVHVTVADVWAHLTSTRLATALASRQRQLAAKGEAWLESARGRCREALPWPELALSRRSALRCRVDFRGLSQPLFAPRQQPALELVLSDHY